VAHRPRAHLVLYIFLSGITISTPVRLSYSQSIADASAHKIKTVDFASGAPRLSVSNSARMA
jgi:hypothetical protein